MFDCCMINDELDILEIRLNTLNDVVEKFVIVESDKTHSGLPKPLHFAENRERFEPFLSKIIHLVYTGHSDANTDEIRAWGNENNQRDMLLHSLNIASPSDSLLCVCDVDEIPHPEKLLEAKTIAETTGMPVALSMYHCLYFLNYAYDSIRFRSPFLYNPYTAQEIHKRFGQERFMPTAFRWHMCTPGYEHDFPLVNDAGWHFSHMGGIENIKNKIESFAHRCQDRSEVKSYNNLVKCMIKGKDIYGDLNDTLIQKDISFLPKYVQNNLEKFKEYIL